MTSNGNEAAASAGQQESCEHDYQLRDNADEYVECTICGDIQPIMEWFAAWYLETSGVQLTYSNGDTYP